MTKKPVVIGLGITQQKGSYAELDEALFLMEKVAMQAINDCGNSKIKDFIDVIRHLVVGDWCVNTYPIIIRIIDRQRKRMLDHHCCLVKQIYNCSWVAGHKKSDITVCF